MKACDIVYPGGSVFELENGDGIRKPGKEDAVKLMFGGIEKALSSQEVSQNQSLPSLEEENLETIFVAHSGAFGEEEWKRLPESIPAVIRRMTLGQKVMIVKEKADEDRSDFPEDWGKGATI